MNTKNTTELPLQTGGASLIAALAAHGVDTVFGIPGTHNLGIFAAMPQHGIRNITPRHEQGAGYAADGYARSTGKIGVVITTTGPAAVNAATALAQSYSDSVPVLLIAPGMPTGHPSHGNGLLHELRDQRMALAGVVAEAHRVESVAEIPVAVAQAFARMTRGRRRSEYLEIPLDLLDRIEPVLQVAPIPGGSGERPEASALRAATEVLGNAEKVVIVAGGGAANGAAELRAVAEYLGAPVITTTNGKGVLAENHPLALGAGMQLAEVIELVEKSDAVLAVGTEFSPADWWGGFPRFPEHVVRIDVDPAGLLANHAPSHAIVGDAQVTLAAMLEQLTAGSPRTADIDWALQYKNRVTTAQETSAATWIEALSSLDAVLPENTVIAADNAMAAYNGALAVLRLKQPRSFLFPTGVGTLGYGLPAGIGAKIARPADPVVVVQGDGGLMFSVAELATAAEQHIALPVLVFDNGGYGEIRNEMADREEPVHSVALGSPDFVALARAMGCHGVQMQHPSELGEVVTEALAADRPTLIHIIEDSRAAKGLFA